MAWFCVGHEAVERDLLAWARRYECVCTHIPLDLPSDPADNRHVSSSSPHPRRRNTSRGEAGGGGLVKSLARKARGGEGGLKVFWQERIIQYKEEEKGGGEMSKSRPQEDDICRWGLCRSFSLSFTGM